MSNTESRQRENARRLAYALERNATPEVLAQLARLLNYEPEQLRKDISDLVAEVEK